MVEFIISAMAVFASLVRIPSRRTRSCAVACGCSMLRFRFPRCYKCDGLPSTARNARTTSAVFNLSSSCTILPLSLSLTGWTHDLSYLVYILRSTPNGLVQSEGCWRNNPNNIVLIG
jgi:hypothetical protein